MKSWTIVVLVLLVGCIGGVKSITSDRVDCGKDVQVPKVSVDVVKEYAPALMKDVLANALPEKCVDKRYVGLVPPECKGEGWGCAVLDPYFWSFVEKEQSVEAFVMDVPGKGIGLHFEMSGSAPVRVIVCETIPVKKGMEQVQALLKDLCYADTGAAVSSPDFCARISSSDVKKECEARSLRNPRKCEGISSGSIKAKCFAEIAHAVEDVSICGMISDVAERQNCELSITGLQQETKGAVIDSANS